MARPGGIETVVLTERGNRQSIISQVSISCTPLESVDAQSKPAQ